MPRTDLILFLDCEMTGPDEEDEVIEIGISVIETEGLTEVDSFQSVVLPSDKAFLRMIDRPVVRQMHQENGLLDDIIRNRGVVREARGYPLYPDTVDEAIIDWLDDLTGKDHTHVPYGGSGVTWFDRPFIARTFPMFNRRITYWAYEIAAERRTYELAGLTGWPSQDDKTHRALDDARFHADELRFIVGKWRELG